MGAAIVSLFSLLGGQAKPLYPGRQPKPHYLLPLAEGQPPLIWCLILFLSVSTMMDSMLVLEIFEKIE